MEMVSDNKYGNSQQWVAKIESSGLKELAIWSNGKGKYRIGLSGRLNVVLKERFSGLKIWDE